MVKKKCLVTIPAYGRNELTHAVLGDVMAESDLVDLLIIDNGGHYEAVAGEWVKRPGRNLGWAGASNLGFRTAFHRNYEYALTLNNDTRLSPGFFAGLLDTRLPKDLGLVAPVYNDWWATQASTYAGAVSDYEPLDYYRRVPMVDGTAMMISANAWETVGGLDERTFGRFAWGSDIDLSMRVAAAGFGIYATERSFLHHEGMVSAAESVGRRRYFFRAHRDCERALRRLYGRAAMRALRKSLPERTPLATPEPSVKPGFSPTHSDSPGLRAR
ncbi:glycosyltransferase [Mycobacterium sp. EPa45]|uniref:glycosyltransferase n=1 Tax=Mycobacterium sp. EPa45 TaxID=1545728 RepID=UPI0009E2D48C|nr:glycosyltransferase [Mycobacterium sp. EPa45]